MRSLAEWYPHAGTYVIDPPRTRLELPDMPSGPFGPVEMLPPVQCIGVFGSHPIDPDADSVLIESTLVVAWYQAEPVLPFDDSTRHFLEVLDWDRLATTTNRSRSPHKDRHQRQRARHPARDDRGRSAIWMSARTNRSFSAICGAD